MEFDDTRLPDHPDVREAFRIASFFQSVRDVTTPDHVAYRGANVLDINARAAEILNDCVDDPKPAQVAIALIFLTPAIMQPHRLSGKMSDEAVDLAREWKDLSRRPKDALQGATRDIRQVMTAVDIALLEHALDNADEIDIAQFPDNLQETQETRKKIGDIDAPKLAERLGDALDNAEKWLESQLTPNAPRDRFGGHAP